MGTPERLQLSVFVMGSAIAFLAEEGMLDHVSVGGMGAAIGLELCKLAGGVRRGTE